MNYLCYLYEQRDCLQKMIAITKNGQFLSNYDKDIQREMDWVKWYSTSLVRQLDNVLLEIQFEERKENLKKE